MTILELVERDLRRAERAVLYAERRPNAPADELEHIRELYTLRTEVVKIIKEYQK